ncbi:DnaJ domain [Trinorchestia longiramus]|nr:DnaJ domain [Trinorchestia longiramus]
MLSHYEVLGVPPEASDVEVRKQYQHLALKLHPDKPAGDHLKFTRLQEAWTVLADPHQRAEYDLQLKRDQLYQQYPISEELFLEDLQCSCAVDSPVYSHVCRCGGRYCISEEELQHITDSEVAVLCDNCSLAIIVVLPPRVLQNHSDSAGPVELKPEPETCELRLLHVDGIAESDSELLPVVDSLSCDEGSQSLCAEPCEIDDPVENCEHSLTENSELPCRKKVDNISLGNASRFCFDTACVTEVETPSSSSPSSNSQSPEFAYLCPSPKSPLRSALHS